VIFGGVKVRGKGGERGEKREEKGEGKIDGRRPANEIVYERMEEVTGSTEYINRDLLVWRVNFNNNANNARRYAPMKMESNQSYI